MKWWRGQYSTLETGPLTGVCVALVLATIPLLDGSTRSLSGTLEETHV